MPRKDYPRNPSLVHFKHQAKDLLKACHASAPEAVARITEFHPRFAKDPKPLQFRLSDAQFVIAREYGFANWEKLRICTLTLEKYGRDTEKSIHREIPAEAFLQLICLNYGMDHPSRREEGQQIFARHPEIHGSSIHVAAATGDIENTRRLLENNPSLARAKGGPMDWEPLMYATYARFAITAS